MEAGKPTDLDHDERVLILTPTGRDAPLIASVLKESSVDCFVCRDIEQFYAAAKEGAGAALIAAEALNPIILKTMVDNLLDQPAWSELPLIVLTTPGFTSRDSTQLAEALEPVGNVTHMERPIRRLTLVSAVRTALRARRRQYQIRGLLAAKEDAILESQNALRRRDEFLAMLGHELRNPLAAITCCLQLLDLLEWGKDVIDEQRPLLVRQTHHLTRLVDDLLDVARVTKGKVELKKSPIDLCDLASRCVEPLRMRFAADQLTLSVETDEEPVMVDGDPVRLEQILTNLLTNAAKFTPPGGNIQVSVTRKNAEAVLSVRDTGIGIPKDMLTQIFDLFAQAHVSIDRTLGGLGLGLTIVHRLVELHGGSVIARSEGHNCGSNFVVRLPLIPPLAGVMEHIMNQDGTLRVLIVEDAPDTRFLMQRVVRLWGHDVDVAADGPQGVEKALQIRPDVVLLDIGLPGFDGYEVARQLRSYGLRNTRIIAVTGYGQDEDRQRAMEAGFDAHMVKPVDYKRLSEMILRCKAA